MGNSKKRAPSVDADKLAAGADSVAKRSKSSQATGSETQIRPSTSANPPQTTSQTVTNAAVAQQNEAASTDDSRSGPSKSVAKPDANAEGQVAESSHAVQKRNQRKQSKGKNKEEGDQRPYKIRKLTPRRPFPTVPTSVSATGPRSAHSEGKNYICITRRTQLGGYLRRCKELVLKDGYKTIHLVAMGAAIPHLARLAVSLPSILPYPKDEIHTEIRTGTAEVHDEIIPDDEDEDISLRKRDKSTLSVAIKIGDGVDEVKGHRKNSNGKHSFAKGSGSIRKTEASNQAQKKPAQKEVIFREGDQDNDDMTV